MQMSTKGRYGIRVMMELAQHYGQGPVPVEEIARNQDISGKYIHILVTNLRSAGLVRAIRGPKGGYILTRPPSALNACEIVWALEGHHAPVECVENAAFCKRSGNCAARTMWCKVTKAIEDVLSSYTLEDLVKMQQLQSESAIMYEI